MNPAFDLGSGFRWLVPFLTCSLARLRLAVVRAANAPHGDSVCLPILDAMADCYGKNTVNFTRSLGHLATETDSFHLDASPPLPYSPFRSRALCSGKTSAFQADDAGSIPAARSKISKSVCLIICLPVGNSAAKRHNAGQVR